MRFVLSPVVKVGTGRLPAFSKRVWFIYIPALESEMRKKAFCFVLAVRWGSTSAFVWCACFFWYRRRFCLLQRKMS